MSHDCIRGCVRLSVGLLVSPSVSWSVGWSIMLLSAGRDKPANDIFCVYELVLSMADAGSHHYVKNLKQKL